MLHHLADSYCGHLGRIDYGVTAGCAHSLAADAEELRVISEKVSQFRDEHRSVILA
jgi:hypothetical protein